MTMEERVEALGYLGLTPRQTRFLVTVMLHSGFCLRRHYAAFAGVEVGKNVRNFLDGLVDRGLARRLQFEINRGQIYHVHARSLYRAIAQDDNRNRRTTSPALIARKLMLLDFVLREPADAWFATEPDKVALFRDRFEIPLAYLPRRVYVTRDQRAEPPPRYFIQKLPIYLAGDPPVVHFVALVTESAAEFARFLWDHRGLVTRLPAWAIVAVVPPQATDPHLCQAVFAQFVRGELPPPVTVAVTDLRWYFATRRAVEANDLQALSVKSIDRFHAARRQCAGPLIESLYADWLVGGDGVLTPLERATPMANPIPGRLLVRTLPFTYTQFGQLPGVA